jgi:ribosomal protein L11 methyltransferase
MSHIKVTIPAATEEQREILIAVLSEEGFDGFEEDDANVYAFREEAGFDKSALSALAETMEFRYELETIAPRNWNEIWEAGFEPVVVEGFCTVRAHFHSMPVNTPYDIIITPKMSFGTGHHATTQLMMIGMQHLDLKGKSVLDFGTGTGVLAILADMLGATDITGIDNDEWAVENALENVQRNSKDRIAIFRATLEELPEHQYDVILANINRHILIQCMEVLFARLFSGGDLLMSGLLADDEMIIRAEAEAVGFTVSAVSQRSGWISVLCKK